MEYLMPAIVMGLTEVYKYIGERFGFEKTKQLILVVAFFLSSVGVVWWRSYQGILDWSNPEELVQVFGLAIAYYEVVVKRVLTPVFEGVKRFVDSAA